MQKIKMNQISILQDYILILDAISVCDTTVPCYALNQQRMALHQKIADWYGYDYTRLKLVLSHLDKAIGLELPLTRTDSSRVETKMLDKLLSCTACEYFMEGEHCRLETQYGVIEQ